LGLLYESMINNVTSDLFASNEFASQLRQKLAKIHTAEDTRGQKLLSAPLNASTKVMGPQLHSYTQFDASISNMFTESEVAFLGISLAMYVRLLNLETDPSMRKIKWSDSAPQKLHQAFLKKNANFRQVSCHAFWRGR